MFTDLVLRGDAYIYAFSRYRYYHQPISNFIDRTVVMCRLLRLVSEGLLQAKAESSYELYMYDLKDTIIH